MRSNKTLVVLLVVLVIAIIGTTLILIGPQIFPRQPDYNHAAK
jgi:hypothetical protein